MAAKDDEVLVDGHGVTYTLGEMGINPAVRAALKEKGVSVYTLSGFYDSGSARSAVAMHEALTSGGEDATDAQPLSKVTIGILTF